MISLKIIKKYHPLSLLPIYGIILKHLLYHVMLDFFSENSFLSPEQSRFRPSDSFINQVLSINHETLNAFDKRLEVRAIFLDVSKAFDKVWHNEQRFKLRQNGIIGDIINIFEDFFRSRKERVILNG